MARPAWAGVIVTDLGASCAWYVGTLGGELAEETPEWAKIRFPNGTCIELFAGDRRAVGRSFPSYGSDDGPPVMPGYAVEEPRALVEELGLEVVRSLPDWIVVAAPDRLRLVLTTGEWEDGRGLVGFRFSSPDPQAQAGFLRGLDIEDAGVGAGAVEVYPVVRTRREGELHDPDGTRILTVRG